VTVTCHTRPARGTTLDLIAALPGLRNWPEVQAFPNRVATCELDIRSAGRVAYRLNRQFKMDLTPQNVLAVLSPAIPYSMLGRR
jgi:hypothetical protein